MKKILLSSLIVVVVFSAFVSKAPKALAAVGPDSFSKGMVSLSFDDGDKSAYDAIATNGLLHNFKSTQYIITAATLCNTTSGGAFCGDFMNAANLQTLYNSGHEIGAHTRTDVCSPEDACASGVGSAGLSPQDLQFQVDGLRQDLLQNVGVFPPVNVYAYPFGSYDDALTARLKSAGIVGARTVNFIDALGQPTYNTKTSDRYHLTAAQVNFDTPITPSDPDPTGFGSVEKWIDQAVADRKWLILVFHEIKADCGTELFCTTPARLSTVVSYLESKGVNVSVPTVGQGLALMNSQPVSDGVAPVITQADITVPATSASGAAVTFAPVVTDADAGLPATLSTFCTIPTLVEDANWGVSFTTPVLSGTNFPMGVTTVTCTAADTGGHLATKTFTITVTDGGPVITGTPADFTVQATSSAGATVTYALPTALDASDGARPVTCTPNTGTVFVFGSTLVTCSASDLTGHTTTTTFTVTVSDAAGSIINTESAMGVSSSSVTFTWKTGHPTTSRVVYDTIAHNTLGSNLCPIPNNTLQCYGYTSTTSEDPTLVTDHSITISGLTTGTTYFFRPVSHGSPETVGMEIAITPTAPSPSTGGGSSGGGGGIPTPTTGQVLGATSTASHPNGTLILDGSTIYLIKNGQRYGFRDANEYQSHGYKFTQTVSANAGDLSLTFDKANIIKALPGTLVLDASDNHTVYMIGNDGSKRGFASAKVFTGLGYSFDKVLKINLADYPVGAVINSSTEAHPDGSLVLDGATVWWILGGTRQGFESEAVFNTYGFSYNRVVKANASDLALPAGALVKLRDGTLVVSGGVYYIISDGNSRKFTSTQIMTGLGYKLENSISASLVNYTAGASI